MVEAVPNRLAFQLNFQLFDYFALEKIFGDIRNSNVEKTFSY